MTIRPSLGADAHARPMAGSTPLATLAAKLRPRELIALLTHHYARSRGRNLPRVKTTLNVANPHGRQAVTIGWR